MNVYRKPDDKYDQKLTQFLYFLITLVHEQTMNKGSNKRKHSSTKLQKYT